MFATKLVTCFIIGIHFVAGAPPSLEVPSIPTNTFPITCDDPRPVRTFTEKTSCIDAANDIAFKLGPRGRYVDRRKEYIDFRTSLEHSWSSAKHACQFFWVSDPSEAGQVPRGLQRGTLWLAAQALIQKCITRDRATYAFIGKAKVTPEDATRGYAAGYLDLRLAPPSNGRPAQPWMESLFPWKNSTTSIS